MGFSLRQLFLRAVNSPSYQPGSLWPRQRFDRRRRHKQPGMPMEELEKRVLMTGVAIPGYKWLETISVNTSGSPNPTVAASQKFLTLNQDYLVRASGTLIYDGTNHFSADAEYAYYSGAETDAKPGGVDWGINMTNTGTAPGTVTIGYKWSSTATPEDPSSWTQTYNANDVYYAQVRGQNQRLQAVYNDDKYTDNVGTLTLDIYQKDVIPDQGNATPPNDDCPCHKGFSPQPVNYAAGVVLENHTDLSSSVTGWNLTRSWTNNTDQTSDNFAGNNWRINQLPTLYQAGTSTIEMVSSGTDAAFFTNGGSGTTWTSESRSSQDVLTQSGSGSSSIITWIASSGETVTFYGFDASLGGKQGKLKSFLDSGGNPITATYNGSNQITDLTSGTLTLGGQTVVEDYNFTWNTSGAGAGMLQTVTLQRSTNGGSYAAVRSVTYSYYDGTNSDGNSGDLRSYIIKDSGGNQIDAGYYRYYTPNSGLSPNTGPTITNITFSGTTVTATLSGTPNLSAGDPFVIAGDTDSVLNGTFTAGTVTSNSIIFTNIAANGTHGGSPTIVARGYQGALKYEFNSDDYARIVTVAGGPSNLDSQADSVIGSYATHKFVYGGNQKVISEVAQGVGNITYTSTTSGFTPGYNVWDTKTVQTNPDLSTDTVYSNFYGQQMAKVHSDGVLKWIDYYQYDASGNLILHANPSAVLGINELLPDLVGFSSSTGNFTNISSSTGLVEYTDYYSSTTANTSTGGGVINYMQDTAISQGAGSGVTKHYQSFTDYIQAASGNSVFNPAINSSFASDVTTQPTVANIGSLAARSTQYSYNYYSGTNQIGTLTTTMPTVTTAENGPGTADVTKEVYDVTGRLIWSEDADGHLTYNAYNATGGLVQTIHDANSSLISSPVAAPDATSSGLHLVTNYVLDSLGRTIQTTDPNGNISFTAYDDVHHAVYSVQGATFVAGNSTAGTITSVVPIQMSRSQGTLTSGNSYTESIAFQGSLTITGGVINAPAFSSGLLNLTTPYTGFTFNIQSLSRSISNGNGQTIESDAYFKIDNSTYMGTTAGSAYSGTSGVNYYATLYGYDSDGRQNLVTSPTGTKTRTVYDSLGRTVSTFVGTNDTSATDNDPTGGKASGNNMTCITTNVYDFGGVGDGNVTRSIRYPGGGAAQRETANLYDWRDRLISSKQGVSLPGGWTDADIGSNVVPGFATYDGTTFVVAGGGAGFTGYNDQVKFASEALTSVSTVTVSARVASMNGIDSSRAAGVMIRQDNSDTSAFAAVVATPTQVKFLVRFSAGTNISQSAVSVTGPVYVKIFYSGTGFTGYYSTDGTTWTIIGSAVFALSSNVLAGVVSSSNTTGLNVATLDHVTVNGTAVGLGESTTVHRPLTVASLDNLGEQLTVSQYDSDGLAMVDTNGDGVPDSLTSILQAKTTNGYDEQGRVYQSTVYSVDPSTGSVSLTGIVTNTWFDHRGEVIKTVTSGGATSKSIYDGVGRVTVSYTSDGGGDSAPGTSGNWSDALTVTGDTVLSQFEYTYDSDGNVIMITDRGIL